MSGQPGQVKRAPIADGKGRPRMWQSMRVLRRFSTADLMASAEVGRDAAAKYVRFLAHAGYLRVVQAKQSGLTGGHAVYALVRDTGPFAPRIGKARVRDPNTEPTAAEPTVSIPRSEYARALRCIELTRRVRDDDLVAPSVRAAAAQALEVAR